jgi:DNA-binding HxlR family transcriptional regulator
VDYELTERGKTLIAPLHMLWTWAQTSRTAIEGSGRKSGHGNIDANNPGADILSFLKP